MQLSRSFLPIGDNQSIRVISEDSAEILFATIEHIKDDDARRSYLLEPQKLVSNRKEKEVTTSITPFQYETDYE